MKPSKGCYGIMFDLLLEKLDKMEAPWMPYEGNESESYNKAISDMRQVILRIVDTY